MEEEFNNVFIMGTACTLNCPRQVSHFTLARGGGYIQVMSSSYAGESSEDYLRFAHAIAEDLATNAADHAWTINFVLTFVALKLDDFFSGTVPSVLIWFFASAHTPTAAFSSRETLLRELRYALSK